MLSHFLLFSVWHWLMLLPSLLWQILLPKLMADVIAIIVWLMLLPLVILCCIYIALAGVIAKLTVANVIAKNLCTIHAKRVTIMPRNIQLPCRIRGDF